MLGLNYYFFAGHYESYKSSFNSSLTRNRQLNRVNSLLLAPPPTTTQQLQQWTDGTISLKTWHKAIAKFATVGNNAGASAIFSRVTARPQLLEKRMKRPAPTNAGKQEKESSSRDATRDTTMTSFAGQKRRCL
jgi:hypothetical protein